MDENHFQDFEYEFDYSIIHKENDVDYFSGILSGALAEFVIYKDNESLAYFLALILQSKILVPVHICPPGKNDDAMLKLPDCKNNSYLYMKNANVVPQIKIAEGVRSLGAFLSIREIHAIAHNNMFMYIDFETVYKWIRKHRAKIDAIVFDPFAKYDYAWYIGVGDFIKQIEVLKKVLKSYQGKNIISDLRTVSIQKHMPK